MKSSWPLALLQYGGMEILGPHDTQPEDGSQVVIVCLPRINVTDNGASCVNEPLKGCAPRFRSNDELPQTNQNKSYGETPFSLYLRIQVKGKERSCAFVELARRMEKNEGKLGQIGKAIIESLNAFENGS
ncbi:hypothetical protein Tco_1302794 [Tanacetum coccineum]